MQGRKKVVGESGTPLKEQMRPPTRPRKLAGSPQKEGVVQTLKRTESDLPGGRTLEQIKTLQGQLPHVHKYDTGRVNRQNWLEHRFAEFGVQGEDDYRAIMAVNVEKIEGSMQLENVA